MVAPSFRYKSGITGITDPTNQEFGAPDINHTWSILDGTNASGEKVQIRNIEGKERLAQFDWLLKGIGTGATSSDVEVWNLNTGVLETTASEFRNAILHVMNTLPVSAPGEAAVVTKIALNGNLDCVTRGGILNRSCVVEGFGTANIRRVANYSNDADTALLLNTSNITLRNFTVEDIVMDTTGYATPSVGPGAESQGILCNPAAPGVENIFLENIRVKNFVHHCMVFSATVPRYIKNLNLRRCVVNSLRGSAITIRTGVTNCNVEYCDILDAGHTGIDLSGLNPPVKIQGCRIRKTAFAGARGSGGIAAVTYAERDVDKGLAEEIILRDNYISGDGITQDAIIIHGEAANVVIENNFIEGSDNGRYGIQLKSFTFADDEYTPPHPQDVYAREVIISHNVIRNTWSTGINLTLEPDYDFPAVSIIGNYIENTKGPTAINLNSDAAHILIANNSIYKVNSRLEPNGTAININQNSPHTLVYGNVIFTDSNATYSIWEQGGGTTNPTNRALITHNQILGTAPKPIVVTGTNSVIAQNIGFRTENASTASATISASNTSVAITHSLGYTPSLKDICVRPTNAMGNATKWWLSSPTSTQFTININVAPGTGNTATFAWKSTRNVDA